MPFFPSALSSNTSMTSQQPHGHDKGIFDRGGVSHRAISLGNRDMLSEKTLFMIQPITRQSHHRNSRTRSDPLIKSSSAEKARHAPRHHHSTLFFVRINDIIIIGIFKPLTQPAIADPLVTSSLPQPPHPLEQIIRHYPHRTPFIFLINPSPNPAIAYHITILLDPRSKSQLSADWDTA